MTSKLFRVLGLASVVTAMAQPASAQPNVSCTTLAGNMVANCSFEGPANVGTSANYAFTSDITDWNSSSGQFERWANKFNGFESRDGVAHLELDVDAPNLQGNTTIWQYINNTVIGQRYDVFFSVGHRSLNGQSSMIGLMINDVNVFNAGPLTDANPGQYKWVDYQTSFVATTTNTKLGFAALGASNEYGDHLDNIGMTAQPEPISVPEPASMALMATGLLGMVGVARRRRNV